MPTFTILRTIFAFLSQTLTKLHDAVSALTRFLEFQPDHMFGDAYGIDKHARQLS